MRDFKFQKTKMEELILTQGHRAMFIPKFHCELNPIESAGSGAMLNNTLVVIVIYSLSNLEKNN